MYSIERFYINETQNNSDIDKVVGGLQRSMKDLKIKEYFEAKGSLVLGCEFVFVAYSKSRNRVIGIISADIIEVSPNKKSLYIATILIGADYRKNFLIKDFFKAIFCQLDNKMPYSVVFKTYNPTSYNAISIFEKKYGMKFYPSISEISKNCLFQEIQHVRDLAKNLSPDCFFDEKLGIIRGSSQGVPDDFYPEIQLTREKMINDYFSERLKSNDRLLCVLILNTSKSKELVYKYFVNDY